MISLIFSGNLESVSILYKFLVYFDMYIGRATGHQAVLLLENCSHDRTIEILTFLLNMPVFVFI